MKRSSFPFLLAATWLFNSCQPHYSSDIVCETYVHRYGMPLAPQEWSSRGQDGQIISTKKDGVTITASYEAGVLNGETIETFPHRDTIAKRLLYVQGQLVQQVDYYLNGMPKEQTTYEGNCHHVLGWYESGIPKFEENYQDGFLQNGEYRDHHQQLLSQVSNGYGLRTIQNDYGQLLFVDEVKEGQISVRRTFHLNGSPETVTPYVNGIIEGERYTYNIGGDPATVEEWSGNLQHGNTQVFENGEKIADQPYAFGRLHGIEYRYRAGSQLARENHWADGKRHGPCHHYVDAIKQTEWFFEGESVSRRNFEALSNQ